MWRETREQPIVSLYLLNFNSHASSVLSFIIPVFFCFVFGHEIMHTLRVLAVFDFFGMFINLCLVLQLILAGSLVPKFLF